MYSSQCIYIDCLFDINAKLVVYIFEAQSAAFIEGWASDITAYFMLTQSTDKGAEALPMSFI